MNVTTRVPAGGFHLDLSSFAGSFKSNGQVASASTNAGKFGFFLSGSRTATHISTSPAGQAARGSPVLMRDPAAVYEMRGDAYADAGQQENARMDYAEAAKTKQDGKALANLCWVRGVRGRPLDRALSDCNEALKRKPGDTNAREARCFVLYRLGRYAEAIPDCDAVLKEKPKTAGALYIRGLAKRRAGDEGGGANDFAAASDLNRNTAAFFALWGVNP